MSHISDFDHYGLSGDNYQRCLCIIHDNTVNLFPPRKVSKHTKMDEPCFENSNPVQEDINQLHLAIQVQMCDSFHRKKRFFENIIIVETWEAPPATKRVGNISQRFPVYLFLAGLVWRAIRG